MKPDCFFEEAAVDPLAETIIKFEKLYSDKEKYKEQAKKFSNENFRKNLWSRLYIKFRP